ncbi:M24 family metallopeptidase [Pelagibius marinus]|uniref:M24 family metallopeptidase n=1 Tax=Pelagibius marinus TaxID=2762760 RepID=UPI00187278F8|nr:Xaa-Pro peptidase family protein [Pelagibius marinus]
MDAAAGAPPRGFPEAEFAQRTEKAQAAMAEAGLDALLLTTEPEVRYFSGFLTQFWQSPTRPWFLVVPAKGKPVAVIPTIGADCMARSWIDDIRTWSSPQPDDDGGSLLAQALTELAGKTGRIGLAKGKETQLRMPLADFERLTWSLPGMVFEDATAILRNLRMVKSEREIAKIAYVCDVVSGAFEAAPQLFAAGQSDIEVFRSFKIECLKRGVDDVSYLVGGAGQGGYGDIISPPSGRTLREGDVLILDTGCLFDGYFCDFDRNFAIGRADESARRAYDVVWRATEAGLQAARPGVTCAELFAAMQGVLEGGGAKGNDVGRLGHGLGMQLTEWPSNTPWDRTVLEPGMVLTLEPGMTFAEGKVMVHEENIVVREEGPELLTRRAPPELPVI